MTTLEGRLRKVRAWRSQRDERSECGAGSLGWIPEKKRDVGKLGETRVKLEAQLVVLLLPFCGLSFDHFAAGT